MLFFLLGCQEDLTNSEMTDAVIELVEQQALESTITVEDVGADLSVTTAKECGDCHPTHYEEWRQSMHAYAAHSPVFDAMAMKAFRDSSGEVGTFCTGCHTPIGTIQGEDGATQAEARSEISKDSVSCETCHSAVTHDNPIGNLSLRLTTTGEKYGPYDASQDAHSATKNEFLTSPEFCGSCHDVFNFPSIRIEEAYSEYTTSPAADQDITCQDCHMSPTPGAISTRNKAPIAVVQGERYPERELSSHRFIGPDYSLIDSFPYENEEASIQAREELFGQIQLLLENAVHISDVRLLDADAFILEVDLESLVIGHNVPTGFTSERQLWLDVSVYSNQGLVFRSGDLDSYGDLKDDHSWIVQENQDQLDQQLVNLQSRNVIRHGELASPLLSETVFPFEADYIEKHSLRPLELRTIQYMLPPNLHDVSVSVQLKYRNLPPYLLRALQLDELVPRLQVFTIDEVEMSFP